MVSILSDHFVLKPKLVADLMDDIALRCSVSEEDFLRSVGVIRSLNVARIRIKKEDKPVLDPHLVDQTVIINYKMGTAISTESANEEVLNKVAP